MRICTDSIYTKIQKIRVNTFTPAISRPVFATSYPVAGDRSGSNNAVISDNIITAPARTLLHSGAGRAVWKSLPKLKAP